MRAHRIVSVAQTLPGGETMQGIDDYTCAGCHQGSNRTVMQYWGIRLDQNQDLRNRVQYPANPVTWTNTSKDTRLFDPVVRNDTFNGRNANQYILYEDYDGDGRDDTPPDVHYDAGMGCIDCHGSADLHGQEGAISSRMEHGVTIQCEDCHGKTTSYAPTTPGTTYGGVSADLALDSAGNPLRHVAREADGNYYLTSRLDGRRHYIPQTRDTIFDSGARNPFTDEAVYSAKASYAMGRDDGLASTGIGPRQAGQETPTGFSHGDDMNCASCHAAWTNTCMGCHLVGEYNTGNNFSNITGERIVFRERNADFTYQSPVYFQLGVNPRNKIAQVSSNTKVFFQWRDRRGEFSEVFAFTDRNGGGNNTDRNPYPSLGHNALMAHSIRGKVSPTKEGPRYCVACHLTSSGLESYGDLYRDFKDDMENDRYEELDFQTLTTHIGQNPGNQRNSPLWVHMVAGLGSGLFLFDKDGCPQNPIDFDVNRKGCNGNAPADNFDPLTKVAFNLDRIVDKEGNPTGSSNHALMKPGEGKDLREHAGTANMAGPLGRAPHPPPHRSRHGHRPPHLDRRRRQRPGRGAGTGHRRRVGAPSTARPAGRRSFFMTTLWGETCAPAPMSAP
ncbi:MAG: cytochrome c3 family protein [Planctomycetes bacterium]|nr:cytochrome c3 family protein [Planctomycetota bacterium]